MEDHLDFLKSCERALVKVRELALKPRDAIADEWLAEVVGMPSSIPGLIEDRMAQIERLERDAAAGRALADGLRVIGKHWVAGPLLKAYDKAVSE